MENTVQARKPRVSKEVMRVLRYARKHANFEEASFSDIAIKGVCDIRFPSRVSSDKITEGIKESTRIYRDTWVLGPLDDLIRWAEGEDVDLHWGRR